MHGAFEPFLVHALAILIDTEAHTTADFLPLADVASALLQRADLEDVRIVPAFLERGVREDEAHRGTMRIEIEQQFLPFHNEVISRNIVR